MSLILFGHPLSSHCQKVLIALHESGADFSFRHIDLSAYFERLLARPSVIRVLDEAKPWLHWFPFADRIPARFR